MRNRLSGLLIAIITIIGFSDSVWADGCVPEKLSQAEISKEVRNIWFIYHHINDGLVFSPTHPCYERCYRVFIGKSFIKPS